jgi:hypothetical protein
MTAITVQVSAVLDDEGSVNLETEPEIVVSAFMSEMQINAQ